MNAEKFNVRIFLKLFLPALFLSLLFYAFLYFFHIKAKEPTLAPAYFKSRTLSIKQSQKDTAYIKLAFVGDISFARGIKRVVEKNAPGKYSFLFKPSLKTLSQYDILFGNLETAVSNAGKDRGGLYSFRSEPEALSALKYAGFNVLSVANNHSLDWGDDAFKDGIEELEKRGMKACGYLRSGQSLQDPVVLERKGIKVAFLCFNDIENMERESDKIKVARAKDSAIEKSVKLAKSKADALVVSFHFGEEYKSKANARQKKLAKLAIDSGADFVVGHHPHVVQNIEKYKDKLIVYSLGNFLFDQNFSKETSRGLLFELVLAKGKILGAGERHVKFDKWYRPYFPKSRE